MCSRCGHGHAEEIEIVSYRASSFCYIISYSRSKVTSQVLGADAGGHLEYHQERSIALLRAMGHGKLACPVLAPPLGGPAALAAECP